jgi:hypothetical protein
MAEELAVDKDNRREEARESKSQIEEAADAAEQSGNNLKRIVET